MNSSSLGAGKGAAGQMTRDLIGADQEIPDGPVRIPSLGKVQTATRSGIKFWFGVVGLAQVVPFWGLWLPSQFYNRNFPGSTGEAFCYRASWRCWGQQAWPG